jgi:hypothetical protein
MAGAAMKPSCPPPHPHDYLRRVEADRRQRDRHGIHPIQKFLQVWDTDEANRQLRAHHDKAQAGPGPGDIDKPT